MLCQRCKKNQATHHTSEIINGKMLDYYYCGACYSDLYSSMQEAVAENLFFNLFGSHQQVKTCPTCGMSFRDYEKSGIVGCADCYDAFREELLPAISRIHGKAQHVGKTNPTTKHQEIGRQLRALQEQLEDALAHRRYDEAGELNAQIKELSKWLEGGDE